MEDEEDSDLNDLVDEAEDVGGVTSASGVSLPCCGRVIPV